MPTKLSRQSSADLLGQSKQRWRRYDDPIAVRQPAFAFGSTAAIDYHSKQELEDKSPGPIYLPKNGEILEKTPEYSMRTTASREYDHKYRNQAKSPGPVYKPNRSYTSKNTFTNGYMGSLARRDYDHKKANSSRSPGPVYNIKDGTTSNRPPPRASSIGTRLKSTELKESKSLPGPNVYNPKLENILKKPKGGHIGSTASRRYYEKKVQCSRSPGPIFLPKKGVISNRPAPRSAAFGKRFKYSDEIEKGKYIAGPGSYTPEIIPRFIRKKTKK